MSEAELFAKLERELLRREAKKIYLKPPQTKLNFLKKKILKKKMDEDNSNESLPAMRLNSSQVRQKSAARLTANDFCASSLTYSTLPERSKSTEKKERISLNTSMGNWPSHRKTLQKDDERGRKQRSAAERLVESRKSARSGSQHGSIHKRSRSVGDKLATHESIKDANKSLDNIPAEIREQFNPVFSQELNRIVRQKSKHRELIGFTDPNIEKPVEGDFNGHLNTISRKSYQKSKSISSLDQSFDSAPNVTDGALHFPINSRSVKEKSVAKVHPKRTNTIIKPPRSKPKTRNSEKRPNSMICSHEISADTSFAGTNNSSFSYDQPKARLNDDRAYETNRVSRNPPTKRIDQPPPVQQNRFLGKDLKNATMQLRTRYSNMASNVTADLSNCNGSTFKRGTLINQTVVPEKDNTRLFMAPGQAPMLHCRNTNCDRTAPLEYAQKNYVSCAHCYTYYCKTQCRQDHWVKHKEKCIYSRAVSTTRSILKSVFQNQSILNYLARLAAKHYSLQGRGALQLQFSSLNNGLMFLQKGLNVLAQQPNYLNPGQMDPDMKHIVQGYQPSFEFVIDIKIMISAKERMIYNRPYKNMVNHVSTAARLPLRIMEDSNKPEMTV